MSSAVPTRDPGETTRALEDYLSKRVDGATVAVSDLTIPAAGFSNETILGRADWTESGGAVRATEFVLRIEPTAHQLFVEPDALRQAQVMAALGGHVPVARIWLTEADPSVLGAPFFLMDRVHGRITSDIPSWHRKGWTTRLDPEERRRLHDNALGELVALHRIETTDEFRFLDPAGDGSALQRYLQHLRGWYELAEPVRLWGADVIDAAMEFVTTERPDDDRASIVWGDARVGNIIFADDLTVAAMLDWEGATLGPPEIDVAWWVTFDRFLCEAQGYERLEGIPDRAATLARYEDLTGQPLRSIGYYEVLAGLVFALINSKLASLLIETERASESVAGEIVTRITDMTAETLDGLSGG